MLSLTHKGMKKLTVMESDPVALLVATGVAILIFCDFSFSPVRCASLHQFHSDGVEAVHLASDYRSHLNTFLIPIPF